MIKEIWQDVPEWEDLYAVSNLGRIKSKKRDKVKVLDVNSSGYMRVQLCDNKRRKKYFVHRLVGLAFVDGYFDGAVINHIDMDRTNNCSWNLEWTTQSENQKRAIQVRGLTSTQFKEQPYKLELTNGATLYFDNIVLCARSVGLCRSTLYNRIKNNYGYLPEVDGYISKCNV